MIKTAAVGVISLLTLVLPRTEQPDRASVGGYVWNDARHPIAGATISMRNVFTGDVTITTSDQSGNYVLLDLPKGRYSAIAMADGHGCVWVPNVFLYSGEHTKLDFTLPRLRPGIETETCPVPLHPTS